MIQVPSGTAGNFYPARGDARPTTFLSSRRDFFLADDLPSHKWLGYYQRPMPIASEEAAEQRAAVAHSASYGFWHPRISKAPAGAEENCLTTNPFLSPHPGLEQISHRQPTAIAAGYYRAPLRGSPAGDF
jgi:hypothetical protein